MRAPSAVATCLLAACASFAAAQPAARPDLCSGRWQGGVLLPGTRLTVDIDFVRQGDGSCTGDISIPQQNARDLRLKEVRVTRDSLVATIDGVPGTPTFTGAADASGQRINGRFTQAAISAAFELTRGPTPAQLARERLAGFDAWIDSAIAAWKVVGLSVGIVVDGETVYLRGHGLRDRERRLPMTPQTLLAIGSSSKAFTTFAMGALVDAGKLRWDAPVRTYLPWFRMHDDVATLRLTPRDLVTHRSGLPRHDLLWYNNRTDTRESLVRRIAHLPLSADLREKFQYNNLMFLTAGYLVGTLNGSSWEDGLRDLVLRPLGMTRTNFSVAESQRDPDHSLGYGVRRDTIERTPFRDISLVGPAGSINSSAEEMTKWITLHLDGGKLGDRQVVQTTTLRDMYRPYTPIAGLGTAPELGPMSYGLGWFIDTYRGRYRVQHGGNIDGFTASVTLLPNERVGIVALANQNGAALPELLARTAMDRLLGGERKDWNAEALAQRTAAAGGAREMEERKGEARIPGTRPSHPLAAYAATYADSGYGAATVQLERDTLVFTYNGISAKLAHWHYETFSALRNPADPTFADQQLTFRTNAKGQIDAMLVTFDPNVPAVVMRREPPARLREVAFLSRLVGRYRLPTGQMVTITLRGATLMYQQGAGAPTELDPFDGTTFSLRANPQISLEFRLDASGVVTGVRGVQPGAVFDMPRVP
ncbi:MAG: serine hydrolase [Gemmatimonadaceae bacterium]|jgi:CubicO group peptidase (beta-lactamase class C family)|nr:serine hydrolase [Gemmatimonadaceae bacterium]